MAFPDALCEVLNMPLAADYRGFDPGRSRVDRGVYEGSWYTTLANLYDISRSQIEQRERKRRARRGGSPFPLPRIDRRAGGVGPHCHGSVAGRRQQATRSGALSGRSCGREESTKLGQGLRLRALLATESLRKAWKTRATAPGGGPRSRCRRSSARCRRIRPSSGWCLRPIRRGSSHFAANAIFMCFPCLICGSWLPASGKRDGLRAGHRRQRRAGTGLPSQ